MDDEKVFSLAEIIFVTQIALIIDIVAAIASMLSLGIVGFFVHAFSWLCFTLWFTIKGVKGTSSLIGRYLLPMAVQAIPILPTTTFTFLATVYIENHPEQFAIIEKVANAAGPVAKIASTAAKV